jgi:hypothetical protein
VGVVDGAGGLWAESAGEERRVAARRRADEVRVDFEGFIGVDLRG